MGRKKWWRGGLELLLLFVLHRGILGDGDVGCLFSHPCNPETEICYNDLAFGKCIPNSADLSEVDLHQYHLIPEELELLRMQLKGLEDDGYKWGHYYTQCVMQILLDDLRYRSDNDAENLCQHLKVDNTLGYDGKNIKNDENLNAADDENLEPERVAIVKFTPSELDPHGEFADELYYPPDIGQGIEDRKNENQREYDEEEDFYDKLNAIANDDDAEYQREKVIRKKSLTPSQLRHFSQENFGIPREYAEALSEILENDPGLIEDSLISDDEGLEFLPRRNIGTRHPRRPADDDNYERAFSQKYKHLKRSQLRDEFLDARQQSDEDYEDGDERDYAKAESDIKPIIRPLAHQRGMFTEGGIVMPLRPVIIPDNSDEMSLEDDLNAMLWRREIAGFKRRERLDVKKPGPPFATNNFAFKTIPEDKQILATESDQDHHEEHQEADNEIFSQQVKKEMKKANNYANVDMDHVYIQVNKEFQSWNQGEILVNKVEKLLGLNSGALKDVRVGASEVTFKVANNKKNFNATDVVNGIDDIRNDLRNSLDLEVIRAGIGDKAKLPAILEVGMSPSMFGAIVSTGVTTAIAAAAVVLIIARRHAKSRAKLAGLRAPDPEASKDYQELCRARMQAKQPMEKSDASRASNIITRLCESPSNRSSISSWTDEPQLTNMDAQTGQAVLSNLEGYLKNQSHLDEEWIGLCAYEPEPSSVAIAEAESNAKHNRFGAALPYDHCRVILNDLANINNTDYINASTITDHDPRNPAYIATQGPMPQTSSDFWQLVWEQGSVVIVMLTRLTEEGQAMCHRYWPEEGSELYHIYEVHLVSEHIWCDDYLVRSFYLKNLRTGETRTVTQFHFLSWSLNGLPQPKVLLEFRRKVNKSYRGRSCPIVVHCSDGGGRTGTYCLIDMVLNRIAKGIKEIDFPATLEHIRDQRPGMVATKHQFEFALKAVTEEIHAILKALPAEKSASEKTSRSSPPASTKGEQ